MSGQKPPVEYVSLSDIVEENGKTIRENNLEKTHNIPIGSLVEVKYDKWFGGGACTKVHARLWVVAHTRDCDGTPLYTVSEYEEKDWIGEMIECFEEFVGQVGIRVNDAWKRLINAKLHVSGLAEEDLTVIEVTDEVERGVDPLRWDED